MRDDAETQLAALLRPIADTYPDHLPEKVPLPAIVYQQTGGQTHNSNCSDDYTADFRIAVYTKTAKECRQLEKQVQAALDAAGIEQDDAPIHEFDFYLKAHVSVLSYLIY